MTSSGSNDIVQKLKDLGLGEKIILGAAVAFFIDSFLPWYKWSAGPFSFTWSGWSGDLAIMSIFALLIALGMAGVIVVKAFGKEGTIPDNISGVTWPKIYLGGWIATAALVAIRFLNHSGDLSFGFFIGIICVAALAAGGFLLFQAEQKGGAA